MRAGRKKLKKIFGVARNLILKVPVVIWGSFALLGAIFFGLMLGYMAATDPVTNPSPYETLTEQNARLVDLIHGYEKLSNLYHLQGENVSVILDRDIALNNPEEIYDAFASVEQYLGLISVQYGRILEMRRSAGLPETDDEMSN